MPVRSKIIFLFSLLAFIILSIVCITAYYFSYQQRLDTIKRRLTNRAITTARLLSQKEIFDKELVRRIDSSTTLALKNKIVQAYDHNNRKIYDYRDKPGDVLHIDQDVLENARSSGSYYYLEDNKDVVAYHYANDNTRTVVVTAADDVEGKNNLSSLLRILLLSFLVGNIFVLVSGYIFSGRLLKPIKQINKDIAEISAQNLARRLHEGNAKDEWYELSHTVNDLLNRLQESFELQRRFISHASHELSTPLTSISSQLEVSFQRQRNPEENLRVMHSINQDVQQLVKLTQALLDFAKASGTTSGIEIDLIRLDEIIMELPSEVAKINGSFSVLLQFNNLPEEEEKLLVFGNRALLQTAIKNMVINACKYSDDHRADVHLEFRDENLNVSIHNTGEGIPEEEIQSIFQPFYRVAKMQAMGGFGLGLSLASRIIKLHKGCIEVRSEKGKETVFTIILPPAHSLHPV